MKIFKTLIILLVILTIIGCSEKQFRSMYDNKTPIYTLRSSVYEPSVDPLDNNFENSQNRPSYYEYRKR